MPKVILTRGYPASGKTQWAKEYVTAHPGKVKNICKDDIRMMLDFGHHSPQNEKLVLQVRDQLIMTFLRKNLSVIISDTNLNPYHERHIRALVGAKATVEIVHFDTSVEECIRRDSLRTGHAHVGETVIRRMAADWERWKNLDVAEVHHEPEPIRWISDAPHGIMCDLDGTLCHHDGKRSPYDWKACVDDRCDETVAGLLALYREAGFKIILISGRDSCCREETELWLKYHGILYDELYMRAEGDNRADDIVKIELFDNHIRNKINIHFVIDDRPRVIRAWKQIGLTVFDVGDGIEF